MSRVAVERRAARAPRRLLGWCFVGGARGAVTGALYPMVALVVMGAVSVYLSIFPPPPEPGVISSSSAEWSVGGAIAVAAFTFLVSTIAGLVGAFVGGAVGLVVGVVCAAIDRVTRRRLPTPVVGLVGAAVYVVVVLVETVPGSVDVPWALVLAGPGLFAAATLRVAPIRFAPNRSSSPTSRTCTDISPVES